MTIQTAAEIIRGAYYDAPAEATMDIDHNGDSILTIGDRRFVLGLGTDPEDSKGEWYTWCVDELEYDGVWMMVSSDGAHVEDVSEVLKAVQAFLAVEA